MSENANAAVQANEDANKKLSVLTKIGYSFGEIGSQCSWTLISSYLTVFYTDVVGLTPVAISDVRGHRGEYPHQMGTFPPIHPVGRADIGTV